jgi:hypothetical protein
MAALRMRVWRFWRARWSPAECRLKNALPAPRLDRKIKAPTNRGEKLVQFIDLSREIYHRTPTHPSHPPVVVGTWYDHDEIKRAGATRFSSKALHVSMSDHAGTSAARELLHRGDLSRPERCSLAA